MGLDSSEQPRLAALLTDITRILDAPEQAWVHARDRPPATVTLVLADFLRRCLEKVMALTHFILNPCLARAAPPTVPVRWNPIPWPPERESLMSEYMRTHTGDASTRLSAPTTVVLHWTATTSAASTIRGFSEVRLAGRASLQRAGAVNVSCHFVVDRDGTIYQLMPTDRVARHAVGMNRNALCIENVGGPDHPLTDAQLHADEQLVHQLVAQNPTIDNVIGHSEYRSFESTYIFRESDAGYRSDRYAEPGFDFLKRFRADLEREGAELRASNRCN